MSLTAPAAKVDRAPRAPLATDAAATVKVRRFDDDPSCDIDAELLDISHKGAKLRITTFLRFEESVDLHIEIPSIGLNCVVLATVRHLREVDDGRWIVGCTVDPPLDEEAISKLLTQAEVDRRTAPRTPVSIPAVVRRQLKGFDTTAELKNLSRGGFCMRLLGGCEVGEQFRMSLGGDVTAEAVIEARVQWRMETRQGFIIGCKLLHEDHYELIAAAGGKDFEVPYQPTATPPNERRVTRPVLLAVVVASCALLSLLLML